MIFQRRKNILAGMFQFFYNSFHIGRKINITPSLVFLISIFLVFFIILVWRTDFFALKNLLVFLILGGIFILGNGVSYYSFKKNSDIYKLEAIEFAPGRLIAIVVNSSTRKEIPYGDISKVSYGGYNPNNVLAKINVWQMHYVVEYKDSEGKINELLVPLDISGLSEFLKIIIEKAELIKVRPQPSLLYEWRKLSAREGMEIAKENDINPIVVNPNASLSNMFSNSEKKPLQEVSYSAIILALLILGIFIYVELVSLGFIN